MNGQSWNRYSYVINNPLALTDTNGYCFLGMCSWAAIGTFFNRTFGAVFRAAPIPGNLLEIVAVALCMANPACSPIATVVAGLTTSFVAGVSSGSLDGTSRRHPSTRTTWQAGSDCMMPRWTRAFCRKRIGDLSNTLNFQGAAGMTARPRSDRCGTAACWWRRVTCQRR
jgi:hypothetical protein